MSHTPGYDRSVLYDKVVMDSVIEAVDRRDLIFVQCPCCKPGRLHYDGRWDIDLWVLLFILKGRPTEHK